MQASAQHMPAARAGQPTSIAVALEAFLASYPARPFSWAAHNCCHFAAAWVQHATGRQLQQSWQVTPTPQAALRLLRELGGDLAAACTQVLGVQPVPGALARLGDVVLVPDEGRGAGGALGVCNGTTVALLGDCGTPGLVRAGAATHAWRLWGAA